MIELFSVPSTLLLNLDELNEGSTALTFRVDADRIDLRDAYFGFPEPLQVSLHIHRAFEMFTLDGRIDAVLRGACCRCLTEVDQALEAPVRQVLQRKQTTDEEREAAAEDPQFEFLDPGVREVNLGDCIRETVLLELPMRIYCQQDCKGLCPTCGHNLNDSPCGCGQNQLDPRWEKLKKIKFS